MALRCAAVLFALFAATSAAAQPAAAPGDLDALRRQCVGAAADTQRQEASVGALAHQIELLGRDAAGRQRDLDDSRIEQQRLLVALAFLARNLPNRLADAGEAPLDRVRSAMLLAAVTPGLRAEAQALIGEIRKVAALRTEIAAKQRDLTAARATLESDRAGLAQQVARRQTLIDRMLPGEAARDAAGLKLAGAAKTLDELIRRADAAAERRDRELLGAARTAAGGDRAGDITAAAADPTRPRLVAAFEPPQSALTFPVAGTVSRQFGAGGDAPASQGLDLDAGPAAEIVAPFDGQVIFAGPFRDLGLVLIIRHGRLYHSLLAGLGRVDVRVGQWVLAGEPVGAMPDAADGSGKPPLHFELRRDGQPVDPQPWLKDRDGSAAAERDERAEDQRVHQ